MVWEQARQTIDAGGRYLSDVRSQIRHQIEPRLLAHLDDAEALAKKYPDFPWKENAEEAFARASHKEMVALTEQMPPANRGSLAEQWYHTHHAPDSARHVFVRAEELNKVFKDGEGLKHDRIMDMLDPDGTIREIKNISGALTERELAQLDDYFKMIGREIDVKDVGEVVPKKIVYAFVNPEGAAANLKTMGLRMLDPKKGEYISIEVFSRSGKKIDVSAEDLSEFNDKTIEIWVQDMRNKLDNL